MKTRDFERGFEFFMKVRWVKGRSVEISWEKVRTGVEACVEPVEAEMKAFLTLFVVLVCGAVCYNYVFYEGIAKALWVTLVQLPFFVAISYEIGRAHV